MNLDLKLNSKKGFKKIIVTIHVIMERGARDNIGDKKEKKKKKVKEKMGEKGNKSVFHYYIFKIIFYQI